MELIRAAAYWMYGPVSPSNFREAAGSNMIVVFGLNFSSMNFNAPRPMISPRSASSAGSSSSPPRSLQASVASFAISSKRSSASTTVPSRLFILPVGRLTMP